MSGVGKTVVGEMGIGETGVGEMGPNLVDTNNVNMIPHSGNEESRVA